MNGCGSLRGSREAQTTEMKLKTKQACSWKPSLFLPYAREVQTSHQESRSKMRGGLYLELELKYKIFFIFEIFLLQVETFLLQL
jgi:hypothetical protein